MSKDVTSAIKKITINSAVDELLGSAVAGSGLIGTSILMKMASGKVNPWVVPVAAFGIGLIGRVYAGSDKKYETIKDLSNGILLAGTLDGAKKVFNKFAGKSAAIDYINASIPQLSGFGETFRVQPGFVDDKLRGMYAPAVVVDTLRM